MPRREVHEYAIGHRKNLGSEISAPLAVEAKQGHYRAQAEQAVDVRSTDMDALVGQDVLTAIRPRPALWRNTHN